MKQVLCLLMAMVCAGAISGQHTLIKNGDAVPEFKFEIEKGKPAAIADYKGKLVLINLFATWCPPCRIELPQMQQRIWKKHKDDPNFALLVFGREEGWDVLLAFKKKFGYGFPMLPDEKREVFGKFATQSIPRNILVDENGKIIYNSIGYDEQEFDKLVELIDKKLKAK
ncbi:TlpA family protein disulfide reductase [Niabella insulamsoli]|uniref:TlpA family protein disulfide reductase n=1 Tax=Niabella insulamsoli TaxID=3144874 RepID=UPI0031FD05AC